MAGSAGNFAVQIGSVVILARLLTPADFGIVTMVTTFSLLFRSFGLNGFTELIIQREELTRIRWQAISSGLTWASGPYSLWHSPARGRCWRFFITTRRLFK